MTESVSMYPSIIMKDQHPMHADRLFELSKLYCEKGDYDKSLPLLLEAAEIFLNNKDFDQYLKVNQYTLRIYAEKEEYYQLSALKEKIQDLVIRENIQLTSRIYYVFGTADLYKGQIENALEYYKIALDQALKADHKEDIGYAILGLSLCYRHQKKYDEALKEIYNLNIFLQFIDNPDLKTSVLSSNGAILADLKRYDQALDIFWQAYEMTKITNHISVGMVILCHIGICLFELGQKDAAKIYFNVVQKTLNPENHKKILSHLTKYINYYHNHNHNNYDIEFDGENHVVKEKQLGEIDFKNQFILLDLLKLFISRQGEVFSKETLVEYIWKQDYDPNVHDNKIYVTIKRLRKLIEPDYDKPKYIFRSKNGYFLNKAIKVTEKGSLEGEI